MKRLVLTRPEPGASDSAVKAAALGIETLIMPLFEIECVSWHAPDENAFDALLMTSANTLRHGGPDLQRLRRLPVHVVGATTAEAARLAGFSVASVGGAGVDVLLAGLPRGIRLLHPGGEDRTPPQAHGAHITPITVYRAAPLALDPAVLASLPGSVIAIHSRRAGQRLAALVADRSTISLVALSLDAAADAGPAWHHLAIAARPTDTALLALAAELCLESDQ
jgi:uroporphyrinogen-III synthase